MAAQGDHQQVVVRCWQLYVCSQNSHIFCQLEAKSFYFSTPKMNRRLVERRRRCDWRDDARYKKNPSTVDIVAACAQKLWLFATKRRRWCNSDIYLSSAAVVRSGRRTWHIFSLPGLLSDHTTPPTENDTLGNTGTIDPQEYLSTLRGFIRNAGICNRFTILQITISCWYFIPNRHEMCGQIGGCSTVSS